MGGELDDINQERDHQRALDAQANQDLTLGIHGDGDSVDTDNAALDRFLEEATDRAQEDADS